MSLEAPAALRFTAAKELQGWGIVAPILKEASPLPLEMPKAESYLVTSPSGGRRLVDRFNVLDMWTGESVVGRWIDEDGSVLTIARLDVVPPSDDAAEAVLSRKDWFARRRPLAIDNERMRNEAVKALSPVEVSAPVRPRRSQRRNFAEIVEYPVVEGEALVWAWRFKAKDKGDYEGWWMASLEVAESVRMEEARARWDEDFLDNIVRKGGAVNPPKGEGVIEGDLLAYDRERSVAAYSEWHAARSGELSILDNLDPALGEPLIEALTNDLPVLRRAYAKSAPSPLAETNSIASVRIFATRDEYLQYVGADAEWSAGQWDGAHRELAAWLPSMSTDSLMRTLRHEAFHQYLAYACALQTASPWFNEGHAEMFEWAVPDGEGGVEIGLDEDAALFIRLNAESLAELIPALMIMDYSQFYDGSDEARELKYRLAWSIAYFLEKGAPLVRHKPFEGIRAKYLKALVESRSMRDATCLAFSDDMMSKLVTEWLKFWKD